MHKVNQTVNIPYYSYQIFQLVADVEKYSEFVPWCESSEINESYSKNCIAASLYMRFIGHHYHIKTKNTYSFPNKIELELVDGPFQYLHGFWFFEDSKLISPYCKVHFSMQYLFLNPIMDVMLNPFFEILTNSIINNFIKRANIIYKS